MAKASVPRLEDWEKLDGDRYKGCVFGREGFEDGTLITTGSVEQRQGNRIKTFSGSVYQLGRPKTAPNGEPKQRAAAAAPEYAQYQRKPPSGGDAKPGGGGAAAPAKRGGGREQVSALAPPNSARPSRPACPPSERRESPSSTVVANGGESESLVCLPLGASDAG